MGTRVDWEGESYLRLPFYDGQKTFIYLPEWSGEISQESLTGLTWSSRWQEIGIRMSIGVCG